MDIRSPKKQLTVSFNWWSYHMTGKPQFRCYLPPNLMDLHSTPEVELHKVTREKTSLYTLRQLQLHQISLKSQIHQMPCQNCLPKIDYKHSYRCREHIHSVSASPSACQMEKDLNMKLISFYTSKDYCANMSWIQTRSSWLLSYQNHGNTHGST